MQHVIKLLSFCITTATKGVQNEQTIPEMAGITNATLYERFYSLSNILYLNNTFLLATNLSAIRHFLFGYIYRIMLEARKC